MKKSILYVVFVNLVLFGCRLGNENKNATGFKEVLKEEFVQLGDSGIDLPVYDFESLSPLLNKKDDKTYIINFWATWCKPCIEELPDFERTFAEQKKNNVEMILVSLDRQSMWEKKLVPFVKEKKLKGKVVILDDPNTKQWVSKLDETWGGGIPATLIYNKDKRNFYPHGFSYDELNKELAKFIIK